MVMRSASRTARKLTFGEACEPKLALRKLFGIFTFTGAAHIPNQSVGVHNACRQFQSGGRRSTYVPR